MNITERVPVEELDRSIELKIDEIASTANHIPGVIIIHDLRTRFIKFVSGLPLTSDVQKITSREHIERTDDYTVFDLLQKQSTNEGISFFQQLWISTDSESLWFMSVIKVLMRDVANNPVLSITTAMPIAPKHFSTAKAIRLVNENIFLQTHHARFSALTNRERDVLRLLTLGKSAVEIADELFISVATAETHRKNIKQKLKTGNSYELSRYAHAFDLI